MNYRHAYHAGNFGDVLKHLVLATALEALGRKDTPYFFLDTHSGRGRYDLQSPEARKSAESANGIGRLAAAGGLPPAAARFVELVRNFDPANAERVVAYPGSPRLAAMLMRPLDRGALCELHPAEADALKREFHGDRRFGVHCRDGYEALTALVPPTEKRGLVLVDPPYEEQETELLKVADALTAAQRHWPQGVYLAWYPIKLASTTRRFHERVRSAGASKALIAELCVHADDSRLSLNGSGMLLLNPPWQVDEALERALPAVHRALQPSGEGRTRVDWLVRE
jgi:23S rRNA (adenine2030-N6)-methyltransferase